MGKGEAVKDILGTLQVLQNTPVPNLLVVAGLVFLLLAFTGRIGAVVELPNRRQKWAGVFGTLLLIFGIGLFIVPSSQSNSTPSDVKEKSPDLPTSQPPADVPTIEMAGIPSPAAIPATEQPALPEQAVRDYYSAINNRQYDVTWARLTTHFKDKFNCCTQNGSYDFNAYVGWWDDVERVDIGEVRVIQEYSNAATVFAQLSYQMKDGRRTPDEAPYIQLILDPTTRTWLFDDKGATP
jgi:hypothetical protein